ncbi:M28 family peptidase [Phytohabitans sp. LJ34]|uniref:M28 family peptidase n=1 Tax=Phytohabitans sp. LJ34 TaxID=3452217 RepID=UPI003F8B5BEF
MRPLWTRRAVLRSSGVIGAGLPLSGGGPSVPGEATMFGWIRTIYERGIRRPGYPADIWVERWIAGQFRRFGLERVRLEPVTAQRWRPHRWSLRATPPDGPARELDCYPVPYAAPAAGLDLELAPFGAAVAGKASLYDVRLLRLPADLGLGAVQPQRVVDPEGTLAGAEHVLPFGPELLSVMEPSIAAGAAAFIGALPGYPGDSHHYFVPYDAVARPIPGVWISGSDGQWLRDRLATGPVRVRLTTVTTVDPVTTHNVVGELPGADDDLVIVGSHHDGPWSSAVEDASGIALVLAQARHWASRPRRERPHRLVFLLHAAHVAGFTGQLGFIAAHRAELDRTVLELHLEHAAREFAERHGAVVPTGLPVPRWFFTSAVPALEAEVRAALVAEGVHRSLILPPTALGERPPTDAAFYYSAGVPIVNFLAAPWYLLDKADTLDKVDRAGLVPLTRAAARIVAATRGVSPADWRGIIGR